MKCLTLCQNELGLDYGSTGYITAYSLRISCCSYLFACDVTGERIKIYMGWALNSDEWFTTYVREVSKGPCLAKFWGSLIDSTRLF